VLKALGTLHDSQQITTGISQYLSYLNTAVAGFSPFSCIFPETDQAMMDMILKAKSRTPILSGSL
jgi:hypothetical protein|tara:strand:+ start:96 stop:290 length:195 start_codon:yes stop_codon:yes gene_type:complete